GALSDFAASLQETRVEAPREDAPHLGVEARFGELVDALQSGPEAVLQRTALRELDDGRASGVGALFVETDDQLGEAEARRLRRIGLLEEAAPDLGDLRLALGLVAKLMPRLANGVEHVPELQRAFGHVVGRGITGFEQADDRVGEIGGFRRGETFD